MNSAPDYKLGTTRTTAGGSHGEAPDVVQRHLDALYSFAEPSTDIELPREAETSGLATGLENSGIIPRAVAYAGTSRGGDEAPPAIPTWARDLLRAVEVPRVPIILRVNGVGLNFNAIEVSQVGTKFCCLLAGELRCDLPQTPDVELVIRDQSYKVVYLGQWHQFSFLPFHVVCFAGPEGPV